MKTIVFGIPDISSGSDNAMTDFLNNPSIRVRHVGTIPPHGTRDARQIIHYECLADAETLARFIKYEQVILHRLAVIADRISQKPGYTKLKNETQREIYLLAFENVCKIEAELVMELARMPAVVEHVLRGGTDA